MASSSSSRGFTLIELLVVIAILGILMALLFPAVQGAINTAKRAQAKNDATQLATALQGYYTEYGKWPDGVGNEVDSTLMNVLKGSNQNNGNPRQIVFLEINDYKKGKSGASGGKFVDPWKQPYQIAVDTDYNNQVTLRTPLSGSVSKTVAVWSPGIPKKGSEFGGSGFTANTDTNKVVKSWE